ncbi:single Ig IL-1-related receptor isoform X2 [Mustelus asterias]
MMWESKQFAWIRSSCSILTVCVLLSKAGIAEANDQKKNDISKPGSRCNLPPKFLSPPGNQTYALNIGSWLVLNCTVKLFYDQKFNWCDPSIEWSKDGYVITNSSKYTCTEETRFNNNASEKFLSSLLNVSVTDEGDYGIFTCFIRKESATFTLQREKNASHMPAVLAAVLVLFTLLLAGLLYVKCRLNLQLWYRNKYGEFEVNDGKLYDAYVSYVSADDDRKFVNFILKPHLENRYGYKLHLDDRDILPGSEPSAELIMNISRCRRLIVVLSKAYLEQDWCRLNFREALWQLLDLSRRPIFIMFESQYRELSHPAIQLLKAQRKSITLLLWTSTSMTPSSEFWKELRLLLPRKVPHRCVMADPQTRLQDDKDPMLILNPDYLDCRSDPDPEGDLGVRAPIYKGPPPPVSAFPKAPKANHSVEPPYEDIERSEVDIADLGSRNYGTRTDFYCLVTEEDI